MPAANVFWTSFCRGLLDLVYPPKCALCGDLGPAAICPRCFEAFVRRASGESRDVHGVSDLGVLYPYSEGPGKAVRRLKYDRVTSLAAPMARLMREGADELGLLDVDLVVPVPIHWTRRSRRGFNQSELLSESLGLRIRRLGGKSMGPEPVVCPGALRRIRATRPQVGLDREQRIRNLAGAFRADPCVSGKRILLVDDVLTTGHTAEECAKTLRAAGATQVDALFFAGDRYR